MGNISVNLFFNCKVLCQFGCEISSEIKSSTNILFGENSQQLSTASPCTIMPCTFFPVLLQL